MSLFTAISDEKMSCLIAGANRRVILAVPAVREKSAQAIIDAISRLGQDSVGIVLDCDEEVFRLGLGDVIGTQKLHDAGCCIRQSSGLRVGVLVCDDQAWVFAPTALYVQSETHSDETPNAIMLKSADVERIVASIVPPLVSVKSDPEAQIEHQAVILQEIESAVVEVGSVELDAELLNTTNEALEIAPPIAFDVARQVRVFEPYIQYVEISLRGCAIQRQRLELPKSIQGIAETELDDRLHTSFDLIEKSSKVSSAKLDKQLKEIRDNLTRALGKPWGRIILKSVRRLFDERIAEFNANLALHREAVKTELSDALNSSKEQLLEYYQPFIVANPPDALRGQLVTAEAVSDEQAREWLDRQLDSVFPSPESLVSEMMLDVQFRDVTFETLNEDGFYAKLKKAYPSVDWDKPFDEFNAAKEKDESGSSNATQD